MCVCVCVCVLCVCVCVCVCVRVCVCVCERERERGGGEREECSTSLLYMSSCLLFFGASDVQLFRVRIPGERSFLIFPLSILGIKNAIRVGMRPLSCPPKRND